MQGESSEPIGGHNPSHPTVPRPAGSPFITIPLDETHRVEAFECPRHPDVQKFIREEARVWAAARLGEVYVLPAQDDPTKIDGYYNLAANSLRREETDDKVQAALPIGTAPIPVFIVGWIGRDQSTYKGLGVELVIDAARRARSFGRVSWGLVLYAANKGLIDYYTSLGFVPARRTLRELAKEQKSGKEGRDYYMHARYEDLIVD